MPGENRDKKSKGLNTDALAFPKIMNSERKIEPLYAIVKKMHEWKKLGKSYDEFIKDTPILDNLGAQNFEDLWDKLAPSNGKSNK